MGYRVVNEEQEVLRIGDVVEVADQTRQEMKVDSEYPEKPFRFPRRWTAGEYGALLARRNEARYGGFAEAVLEVLDQAVVYSNTAGKDPSGCFPHLSSRVFIALKSLLEEIEGSPDDEGAVAALREAYEAARPALTERRHGRWWVARWPLISHVEAWALEFFELRAGRAPWPLVREVYGIYLEIVRAYGVSAKSCWFSFDDGNDYATIFAGLADADPGFAIEVFKDACRLARRNMEVSWLHENVAAAAEVALACQQDPALTIQSFEAILWWADLLDHKTLAAPLMQGDILIAVKRVSHGVSTSHPETVCSLWEVIDRLANRMWRRADLQPGAAELLAGSAPIAEMLVTIGRPRLAGGLLGHTRAAMKTRPAWNGFSWTAEHLCEIVTATGLDPWDFPGVNPVVPPAK